MKKKMYEFECQRSNVTPKQFFTYCKNQMEKKSIDIKSWIEFENWENPINPEKYHVNDHKDWEVPQREALKNMPYDWQMFLQDAYNFIMEFEFDTETKGHGYLYVVEYER